MVLVCSVQNALVPFFKLNALLYSLFIRVLIISNFYVLLLHSNWLDFENFESLTVTCCANLVYINQVDPNIFGQPATTRLAHYQLPVAHPARRSLLRIPRVNHLRIVIVY